MRNLLVVSFLFVCMAGYALPKDSVAMTINGKPISLAEFEYFARKNNEVNFNDEKSIKEYAELFKIFKLKVTEAEELGVDKTKSFTREVDNYNAQLRASYLSDREGEEAAARVIYDREGQLIELSQIMYPFSKEQCVTQDTVKAYEEAYKLYERLRNGENIDTVGVALMTEQAAHHHHDENCKHGENCEEEDAGDHVHYIYQYIRNFQPKRYLKAFDDAVYSLQVGELSKPIRTSQGFHIVQIHTKKQNPGTLRIAHLLVPFLTKDSVERTPEETLKLAQEACAKAKAGEDFATLIQEYSTDTVKTDGLYSFVAGELLKPVEDAAYALARPGDISQPIRSQYGYHIIKLISIDGRNPFDSEKEALIRSMRSDEWNFELFRAFDNKLKRDYKYVFHADAYKEMDQLCDTYFPTSQEFYDKIGEGKKPLVTLNGEDHLQAEFAYYLQRNPFSTKSYSKDFMKEVFDLFVRDLMTIPERRDLEVKYPEIPFLKQEFRDGTLLFEISSQKIWSAPADKQEALEQQWIKDLEKKYPVEINWKRLKKLKNK